MSCYIVIDDNLLQGLYNCYKKVTFPLKYRIIKLEIGVIAVLIHRQGI